MELQSKNVECRVESKGLFVHSLFVCLFIKGMKNEYRTVHNQKIILARLHYHSLIYY